MTVNSYPELFTTLIGWQQYANLWDIIVHTGLAFLPFSFMMVKNTVQPLMSQEAKSAQVVSLRRVEFQLAGMILVIMFACQPMITVEPSVVHYNPVCNPSINATPGNSGTTYDESFPPPQAVKVPLWWYAIMGLSSGLTASSITGLGCTPDLREVQLQLHLTQIQSAPLRAEVQQFFQSCFEPAWRTYNQKKPNISQYTAQYGDSDPEWMGSHAFINLPGYYDAHYAPEPIEGFPYNAAHDWTQGKNHGQWGAPSCKAWWTAPTVGLYAQLKAQIKPSLWQKITSNFHSGDATDAAIQELISDSFTQGYHDGTDAMGAMTGYAAGGLGTDVLASIGTAWHALTFFPKMYVMIQTLPLIQAYLLMACFVFLAIALPMSEYKIGTVLKVSFVIFAISFWSYLWALASFVDTSMIKALDGTGGLAMGGKLYGGAPMITDMVAILMYVGLPTFFTLFMGWVGVLAGNGVNGMVDRASSVAAGGAAGASTVGKAASLATKLVK